MGCDDTPAETAKVPSITLANQHGFAATGTLTFTRFQVQLAIFMFSVVCVYNNVKTLEARLLPSLATQTGEYEIFALDNCAGQLSSAAAALNHGVRRATGEWVLFAHQDVMFLSAEWLDRAEQILEQHQPTGWAGVAGMSNRGVFRGLLLDRAQLLGSPSDSLAEVQTLDECLLISRRRDDGQYFDENLRGWHAYGVDACCRAIEEGGRNHVLTLPVWHDSKSTNLSGLAEAHNFVWHKHRSSLPKIYTTCGAIPDEFVRQHQSPTVMRRAIRWGRCKAGATFGAPTEYVHHLGEALERLTENEALTEVLHCRAGVADIEARGFVPLPQHARRVLHSFRGLPHVEERADCVVIIPDLVPHITIPELNQIIRGVPRVLVCMDVEDRKTNPDLWRALQSRSVARLIVRKSDTTINYDGLPPVVSIFELRNQGLSTSSRGRDSESG